MTARYPAMRAAAAQRGAAALLVVVVLFFILALVTAYTSRNLIFEQRTSANNQRTTQALEVAEAGVEFAIALLGGGRIHAACIETNDTAQSAFRQRYLTQDTSGTFVASASQPGLRPTCMLLSSSTSCSCPASGAPDLVLPVGLAPRRSRDPGSSP